MESYDKDQPSEASVKVSSRFNMMYSYFFEKGEIIGLFSPKVNIVPNAKKSLREAVKKKFGIFQTLVGGWVWKR